MAISNALNAARPGIVGKTGVAKAGTGSGFWRFFTPVPALPDFGPKPTAFPFPWLKRRIVPIAVHDTAMNTVNDLFFVRPMPAQMAPDSNPVPPQAYSIGPRPVVAIGLAAGMLNVQQQLGSMVIQAQDLTAQASNFFGD